MRNSAIVLAVEDPTYFSRISAIVHSWIGARLLVDSLGWIPLLRGGPAKRESGRIVLVLIRLSGIVAVFLVDLNVGTILWRVHLLLPPADVSSFVVATLLIVVAVTKWRSWWPESASVVVLASAVAISLIAAQYGAISIGLLAAAWIAWVGHHIRRALMLILGRLVRSLPKELLSEACLVVVVSRLSHLHLKLYLILGWILPWRLGVVVALNIGGPHLVVGDVVIAIADRFLGMRRHITST